jgi:hypothetical protein
VLGVQVAPLEQLPVGSVSTDPLHVGVTLQLAPVVVEQVPTVPVRLQAWQAPAQDVLQQTPLTQLPLVHLVPSVPQTVPLFGAMHDPPMQKKPEAQSAVVPHVVGQPVVLHA